MAAKLAMAIGFSNGRSSFSISIKPPKAIQSASFGGGSSGGGGGGALVARQVLLNLNNHSNHYNNALLTLICNGGDNTMYKRPVRTLIQRIGEEVKDGAVLRVS